MILKELIRRVHRPRIAHEPHVAHDARPTAAVEGPKRCVALVIAEPELASAVSRLYQARDYDVFVPETPRDVIETLAAVGNQVQAVLISAEATWANDLRELIADKCPKIDRVMVLS